MPSFAQRLARALTTPLFVTLSCAFCAGHSASRTAEKLAEDGWARVGPYDCCPVCSFVREGLSPEEYVEVQREAARLDLRGLGDGLGTN